MDKLTSNLNNYQPSLKDNSFDNEIELKKSNFLRYLKEPTTKICFDEIFGDKEKIKVDRKKILGFFKENIKAGIVLSTAWGFPKGVKPGGRRLEIFEEKNIDYFADKIKKIQENTLDEYSWNELNKTKGIKNGVTTKLLYFSGCLTSEYKCLIYDSRVRNYLKTKEPQEFSKTLEKIGGTSIPNFNTYYSFCKEADELAKKTSLRSDAIEYYLFKESPKKQKSIY